MTDEPLCPHGRPTNQDCFACDDLRPPTMPDSFMPEMTTQLNPDGVELRIGLAFGPSGERHELGYVLSTPHWPGGRKRQALADAGLRYSLWLALHGVDFTPSSMRIISAISAHYGRDCDHS